MLAFWLDEKLPPTVVVVGRSREGRVVMSGYWALAGALRRAWPICQNLAELGP